MLPLVPILMLLCDEASKISRSSIVTVSLIFPESCVGYPDESGTGLGFEAGLGLGFIVVSLDVRPHFTTDRVLTE